MLRILGNILMLFLFWSCGSQREVESKDPPPPDNGTPPGDKKFADVQAITNQYCFRCHSTSQFLRSESQWRASEAKDRLTARTMPPAGTNEAKNLSNADRSFLISF